MEKKRLIPGRDDRIKLMAHRGFTPMAPQNSIPAFMEAARRGFWGIETDVRMTADGYLVCIHDATVDSLYLGSGAVAELRLAELRALVRKEIGMEYPPQYAEGGVHRWTSEELCVPLYSQYLQICRVCQAVPFVETKTENVREVLEATTAFFAPEEIVMSSVQFSHIERVRKLTDRVFVHHIFSDEDHLRVLAKMGRSGLSYNYPDLNDVPDGLIERTHEKGVCVCFRAGDSPETARRMAEMGVDYVPTNLVEPEMLS